ncbi:hypothetical protein PLESTM_000725200 [Pleodorina starrii]|nr:hypothetical protein PLESTM_000725200 [Pleodorina starrii]
MAAVAPRGNMAAQDLGSNRPQSKLAAQHLPSRPACQLSYKPSDPVALKAAEPRRATAQLVSGLTRGSPTRGAAPPLRVHSGIRVSPGGLARPRLAQPQRYSALAASIAASIDMTAAAAATAAAVATAAIRSTDGGSTAAPTPAQRANTQLLAKLAACAEASVSRLTFPSAEASAQAASLARSWVLARCAGVGTDKSSVEPSVERMAAVATAAEAEAAAVMSMEAAIEAARALYRGCRCALAGAVQLLAWGCHARVRPDNSWAVARRGSAALRATGSEGLYVAAGVVVGAGMVARVMAAAMVVVRYDQRLRLHAPPPPPPPSSFTRTASDTASSYDSDEECEKEEQGEDDLPLLGASFIGNRGVFVAAGEGSAAPLRWFGMGADMASEEDGDNNAAA